MKKNTQLVRKTRLVPHFTELGSKRTSATSLAEPHSLGAFQMIVIVGQSEGKQHQTEALSGYLQLLVSP